MRYNTAGDAEVQISCANMYNRGCNASGNHIIGSGQTDKLRFAVPVSGYKKPCELCYGNLIDRHQKIAQAVVRENV